MCHNTGKTVTTKFSTAGVVKYDTMQTDCSVCSKPLPKTKAGRPKKHGGKRKGAGRPHAAEPKIHTMRLTEKERKIILEKRKLKKV
jgi:hypothetical protein